MSGLNGRYYAGKVIVAEFSPVTDFREAKCRQYNEGACDRGGYCNFMHPKHVTRDLKKQLFKAMYDDHPDYREDRKNRTKNAGEAKPTEKLKSRSRSPVGNRDNNRDRGSDRRDRGSDRLDRGSDRLDRDRKRSRSRSGDRRKHSRRSRSREHRRKDSRERRPDSRDRHRDRKDRDRRDSRSRRDDNGVAKKAEDTNTQGSARMNSEERRAMIAKWNAEEEKDTKQ